MIMTKAGVVFEKLILEGFGPYKNKSSFTFDKGINRFVAENESGKSTMVAGIAATLFGVSHRQNTVDSYSLKKFKNWDNPNSCTGTLFLESNGVKYKITRDFESHKVSVWEIGSGKIKDRCLVEDIHNPEGRKNSQKYEEKLKSILGFTSKDLFEDIFFVAQPLPEAEQVSSNLQGLLSGGSGGTFEEVLDWLVSELKKLTKYTGPNDRGVTSRNMGKDGELETIDRKIQELTNQLAESEGSTDALLKERQDLQKLNKNLDEYRKIIEKNENTLNAYSLWSSYKKDYATSAKNRDVIKNAYEKLNKSTEELENAMNKISINHPEFQEDIPELDDKLRGLINLDEDIASSREKIEQTKKDIKLKELDIEKREGYLNFNKEWVSLGSEPVEKVNLAKKYANDCIYDWRKIKNLKESFKELDDTIFSEFLLLESSTDEEIEKFREFPNFEIKNQYEIERKREDLEQYKERIDNFNKRQSKHNDNYSEYDDFTEEIQQDLQEKWGLLKEKRRLVQEMEQTPQKKSVSIATRSSVAVILAVLAFIFLRNGSTTTLVLGTAISLLAGFFGSVFAYNIISGKDDNGGDKQLEYQSIISNIEILDKKLGKYSEIDDMDLVRVMEDIKRLNEEKIQLDEERSNIENINVEEIEKELDSLLIKKEEYLESIGKLLNLYDNPSETYVNWLSKKQERERIKKNLEENLINNFGTLSIDFENAKVSEVFPESQWYELFRLMSIILNEDYKEKTATLDQLIDKVCKLEDEWWEEKVEAVREYSLVSKELQQENDKLGRFKDYLQEITKEMNESEIEREKLIVEVKDVLEFHSNDPKAALESYKKYEEEKTNKNNKLIEISTMLNQFSVENIEQLQEKLRFANDDVNSNMLSWKEHIKSNPGLPDISESEDSAIVERRIGDIRAEVEEIKDKENSAIDEIRLKNQSLGKLEGSNTINIAVAELELAELKKNKVQIELLADSLTLAYKEMKEAIKEFSQSYKSRLEDAATDYLVEITGNPNRLIDLDDQLNINVVENGRNIMLDSLSRGAKDQMYLSLRLAIADLISDDLKLPFIFDDSFTNTDELRLSRIRELLENEKDNRQFFVLAHSTYYDNWGNPIEIQL